MRKIIAGLALMAALTATGFAQNTKQEWFNPPKTWRESGDTLTETVPPGTDYWRIAHYGFIRDTGPFRYQEQSGDFEATVRISGRYHELYNQAGLMIRIDEKNWIKSASST